MSGAFHAPKKGCAAEDFASPVNPNLVRTGLPPKCDGCGMILQRPPFYSFGEGLFDYCERCVASGKYLPEGEAWFMQDATPELREVDPNRPEGVLGTQGHASIGEAANKYLSDRGELVGQEASRASILTRKTKRKKSAPNEDWKRIPYTPSKTERKEPTMTPPKGSKMSPQHRAAMIEGRRRAKMEREAGAGKVAPPKREAKSKGSKATVTVNEKTEPPPQIRSFAGVQVAINPKEVQIAAEIVSRMSDRQRAAFAELYFE